MEPIVKRLRSAMGLSQEEFARKIGRSIASIRRYETGLMPPVEVLGKMLFLTRTTPGLVAIGKQLEKSLGPMLITAKALDLATAVIHKGAAEGVRPQLRAGLHSMVDYVLDNGRPAAVAALCET